MKVIFLDHDGVICLSNNWGGRMKKQKKYGRKLSQGIGELPLDARFDDFDKKAIEVLNFILEETGAEIVVSSDWKRWATTEELGVYYEQQGIIKKPIDFKSIEIKNSLKKIVSCLEYDIFNKSNHFSFHLSKNDKIKKESKIEFV